MAFPSSPSPRRVITQECFQGIFISTVRAQKKMLTYKYFFLRRFDSSVGVLSFFKMYGQM